MNKIKYFEKEIGYLKKESNKEDLKKLINLLPDYFFEIPASSTGKYHPKFSTTNHGLLKHTKVAVRIAYELFNIEDRFTDEDKDLIIMALVLHDGCKLGISKEEYTKVEHPLIVSKLIMEHHNELQMDIIEVRKLCTMIEAHMGKWNKDYKGNEILPIPRNEIERFVHKCDYLSSRKFLNIKFKNMEISEE